MGSRAAANRLEPCRAAGRTASTRAPISQRVVSLRFARSQPASARVTRVRCTVDFGRPKSFVSSPTVTGWCWATASRMRSDLVTLFISIRFPPVNPRNFCWTPS